VLLHIGHVISTKLAREGFSMNSSRTNLERFVVARKKEERNVFQDINGLSASQPRRLFAETRLHPASVNLGAHCRRDYYGA
jgi:hypothetical protein